jgi:formamidopyrimidine-DNA glycosylase
MIEMPEAVTVAGQMNSTLAGKTVARFWRGNLVHKFLWLNRPAEEIDSMLAGRTITGAASFGRSIHIHLGGENLLWFSDFGGRILFHAAGEVLPQNAHLVWDFADGSHLTFAMQMWGAVKLLERADFGERPLAETGTPPLDPDFTFEHFDRMLDAYPEKTAKGVKGFLVATGHVMPDHVSGLGNAYVQDVLFRAGIDPRRKVMALNSEERRRLFTAIQELMSKAIELGGRDEEVDLFNQPGRYVRLMGSQTAGKPCPACGTPIQKIAYLGGACYLCPQCQN